MIDPAQETALRELATFCDTWLEKNRLYHALRLFRAEPPAELHDAIETELRADLQLFVEAACSWLGFKFKR
jgi:hypothetical protein